MSQHKDCVLQVVTQGPATGSKTQPCPQDPTKSCRGSKFKIMGFVVGGGMVQEAKMHMAKHRLSGVRCGTWRYAHALPGETPLRTTQGCCLVIQLDWYCMNKGHGHLSTIVSAAGAQVAYVRVRHTCGPRCVARGNGTWPAPAHCLQCNVTLCRYLQQPTSRDGGILDTYRLHSGWDHFSDHLPAPNTAP